MGSRRTEVLRYKAFFLLSVFLSTSHDICYLMLFKARKVNNLNYHECFRGMLGLNVYGVFML